ncbi:MAG: glutathione S-transferase family protein [Betaproteobacteria bacterium]
MSTKLLRLHFSPGSCSRVTMIALAEAGAEYEATLVSLKDGAHRTPAFRALNAKGKVPVLETPEGVLTENVAILTWLADRHPDARLLPVADAWQRATSVAALAWFASTVHPLLTSVRYPERVCDLAGAPDRVRAAASGELAVQMRAAEDLLLTRPWMLGDRWSVADAYLFWCWGRCGEAGLDAARFPRIAANHEATRQRPAVLRALARERTVQEAVRA